MNLRTHLHLILFAAVATATLMAKPLPFKPRAFTKPKLDAPSLQFPGPSDDDTIVITVCAGSSGAPGGFLLQWQTAEQLDLGPDGVAGTADDGKWYDINDPRSQHGMFPGANPQWSLGSGACVTLTIGGTIDPLPTQQAGLESTLKCGTAYVFRVNAIADCDNNRSEFSSTRSTTTIPCKIVDDCRFCTRSQGFFSNGASSLAALLTCFGGDGGTGPTAILANSGPIATLGGGTYTYQWFLTQDYIDIDPNPLKQQWVDTGLMAFRKALGGNGPSGPFSTSAGNSASMGTGGTLASQVAALTINLSACGDPAYGKAFLCSFAAGQTLKVEGTPISEETAVALNGRTVADVLAAANAYLGNGGTVPYGLGSAAALNELIDELNLAFDGKDWDGDGIADHECGGKSEFGMTHICCTLESPGDPCTKSQGYFSSGAASLEAELACFGGDGGTGTSAVTAPGGPLITIGGGTFTYTWKLTQSYVDIDSSPKKYRWIDTGLLALREAIGGGGKSGIFTSSEVNPTTMGTGGGLASQTAALTLNVSACGDPTYGALKLCRFVAGDTLKDGGTPISAATATALNGQTVVAILNATNLYLGSGGTVPFGLASASELNALIDNLNLAYDNPYDSDGDGTLDRDCGGASTFATNHLCL